MFGIFIIIRVIKIIIDTAIHGYALHMAYGCSLHLLGAIWSSLTHLLLHLAHPPAKKKKEKPAKPAETITMSPVETTHAIIQQTTGPASAPTNTPIAKSESIHAETHCTPSLEYRALSKRLDEIERLNP